MNSVLTNRRVHVHGTQEYSLILEALSAPNGLCTALRLSCGLGDAHCSSLAAALEGNGWLESLELTGQCDAWMACIVHP